MSFLIECVENIDEIASKIPFEIVERIINIHYITSFRDTIFSGYSKVVDKKHGEMVFVTIVYDAVEPKEVYRLLLFKGKVINAELRIASKEPVYGKQVVERLCKIRDPLEYTIYRVEIPVVKWINRLKFGIPVIDKVHEEMLNMLNSLIKAAIFGEFNKLDKLVNELYDHTLNKHFKVEEDLMIKYGYPNYVEHKRVHEMYIEVLEEMKEYINRGEYKEFLTDILLLLESYLGYLEGEDHNTAIYLKSICGDQCTP